LRQVDEHGSTTLAEDHVELVEIAMDQSMSMHGISQEEGSLTWLVAR
jgi:hypothetical protein